MSKIKDNWQNIKLKDIAEVNKASITKGKFQYDEIEYIDISSVGTGELKNTTTLPLQKAPSRAKRLVQPGSIILSTVRPNRRSFYYIKKPKENCVVSTGFGVIDAIGGLSDSRFLYYVITDQAFTNYLVNHAKGAAYPAVDSDTIENADLVIPPLPTQQRIASILSAFDDLIENNTRRIKILEEMAQAIYEEWFVRYRFPGHENVRMVDSGTELGEIPEGWEMQVASEVIQFNPTTKLNKATPRYFVAMENISNWLIVNIPKEKVIKNGRKFKDRDVILPRITPCLENGKGGFVFFEEKEEVACGSTEFIVMREEILPAEYIYCLSRNPDFRRHAQKSMVGASGRQRVQEACFDTFNIAIPPGSLLAEFSKKTAPLYVQTYKLNEQLKKLRETRDLLLPKLVSGEIEIQPDK